jgi:hypothetical protein
VCVEVSGETTRRRGPREPVKVADALTSARQAEARAAILVEGWSDQAAVVALAAREAVDLQAERILVVPIGGVTNLLAFARALGGAGCSLALAGLYDRGEQRQALQQLVRSGLALEATADAAEAAGFFMCDADLEDELIQALGAAQVESVLDAEGELASFRRFQEQPQQRAREHSAQLRRFLGTRSGRKVRYGKLLVDALDLGEMPLPLRRVLAAARR